MSVLHNAPRSMRKLDSSLSDTSGEFAGDAATAVWLLGRHPQRALHRFAGALLVMLLYAGLLALLFLVRGVDGDPGVLLIPISAVAAFVFPATNQLARRSRFLWLTSGKSRSELFRTTERWLWITSLMYAATFVPPALALLGFVLRIQWSVLLWISVLAISSILFASYLGLMLIRGLRPFDVAAIATLIVSVGVTAWYLAVAPMVGVSDFATVPHDVLARLAALQLAAALLCRFVAKQRWRSIDWMPFRPLRLFRGPRPAD